LLTNHGVYTGLSVATVSAPLVYSSFWMPVYEQFEAELAGLLPPPLAVLPDEVLPQAATAEPMSVVAAAATMMRRI
jgi:hypothetical protein